MIACSKAAVGGLVTEGVKWWGRVFGGRVRR
jgi:hypothetical protein